MNKPKSCRAAVTGFRADDFAALREFLRGYLHEDFRSEYGSPEAAAATFCGEADGREREAAAAQLARFLELTRVLPPAEVLQLFRQELGSGWNPASINALQNLLSALLREPKYL